jgi:hypothetical protein
MFRYEFVDVELEGHLRMGKTDTFEKCKDIIVEKAKEGRELVQIVTVGNEKTGVGSLVKFTIIFKVEEN